MHRAAVRRWECDWGVLKFALLRLLRLTEGCMYCTTYLLNTSRGTLSLYNSLWASFSRKTSTCQLVPLDVAYLGIHIGRNTEQHEGSVTWRRND